MLIHDWGQVMAIPYSWLTTRLRSPVIILPLPHIYYHTSLLLQLYTLNTVHTPIRLIICVCALIG
jgi:hypothetical protein